MSHTQKTKSFYQEQKKKYLEKHPEMETYYDDKPITVFSGERQPKKSKLVWNKPKAPRLTKPCAQCGETIEKPLREGARSWEQRKFCSPTCKRLKHETMSSLSKSN